jgi:hypothetical protein
VRSRSPLTNNLRVGCKLAPKAGLTLDIFTLLDRRVEDIQ